MFENLTVKEKVWLAMREVVRQRASKYTENGIEIICNKFNVEQTQEIKLNVTANILSSNNSLFPAILQTAVDSYNNAYNKHGRDKLMLKYTLNSEADLMVNAGFFEDGDEVSSTEGIKILPFLDESIDRIMSKYLLKDIQKVDISRLVRDFQIKLDHGRYFYIFTVDGKLTNNPFSAKIMETQNLIENDDVYKVVNMIYSDRDKIISPDGFPIDKGEKETALVFKTAIEKITREEEVKKAAIALLEKENQEQA